ncbi:MAG: hypothetical protein M1416_03665 [Candidatus Pacearchaeota archaeon]|nr:hypothetical protein [Candidatus Pacearchaeota archaeon]
MKKKKEKFPEVMFLPKETLGNVEEFVSTVISEVKSVAKNEKKSKKKTGKTKKKEIKKIKAKENKPVENKNKSSRLETYEPEGIKLETYGKTSKFSK